MKSIRGTKAGVETLSCERAAFQCLISASLHNCHRYLVTALDQNAKIHQLRCTCATKNQSWSHGIGGNSGDMYECQGTYD